MLPFLQNRSGLLRWILFALAETAVVIPWMILLYSSEGRENWADALPGAWLPLVLFLAAGLWEAGDRKDDPRRRTAAMVVGIMVGYLLAYQALPEPLQTGLLSWNPAWFFVPVAAYLWFQGARGAIEGIEYGRIFSRFGIQFGGLLVGVLFTMLSGVAGDEKVQLLLYWAVILLFAAGLSLLVVTRERALRADQAKMGDKGEGGAASPVMRFVVLGLVGPTMAASYLLSMERLLALAGAVADFISPLANWLWNVAMLIVVRWLLLLSPLWNLIGRMRGQEVPPQEGGDELAEPEPLEFDELGEALDLTPYLKAALLIAFLAVLAIWLYRLNRQRRTAPEDEEERVSLGFWNSLWADLRALFGQFARRTAPVAESLSTAVLGEDPRDPRILFRRLQAWGASRGRPRWDFETPNRYRQALGQAQPEAEQPAEAVTAVYNQARYGPTPPDEAAVDRARRAIDELEKPAKGSA